ncbi:uncharacterized protein LOC109801415 [Cajanus cajan]|uniref:uncharacterized protein LOC109801415 n=1 Tax=Cajanus cajan TaxID=3821 RepID=UPI00098DC097|nr:uncharacterized protein LOC109801415 [Cajanus cajan]
MEDHSIKEQNKSDHKKSYAESVLSTGEGKIFSDYHCLLKEMEDFDDKFSVEMDQTDIDEEDLDPCPTINVSQDKFEEWCSTWRNALVINVLGKQISFKALENKINRDWVRSGSIRIIDMPNDYYLVQFSAEEDYRHALYEGPWMIANHYILVQRWRPFFTITASQTRKVAARIRIPGLPIKLYNDHFLWRVGSKLGTMLKIDKLTSIHSRGKFARICVEVNLRRKLVSKINVLGHIIKLEYEGLHSICFGCCKYGRIQDQCREGVDNHSVSAEKGAKEGTGVMDVDTGNLSETMAVVPSKVSMEPDVGSSSGVDSSKSLDVSEELYGPWMLVKKNKKSNRNNNRQKIKQGNLVTPKAQFVKETNIANNFAHEDMLGQQGFEPNFEGYMLVPEGPTSMQPMHANHISKPKSSLVQSQIRVRNPLAGKNSQIRRGNSFISGSTSPKKKGTLTKNAPPKIKNPIPDVPKTTTIATSFLNQQHNSKMVLDNIRFMTNRKGSNWPLDEVITKVVEPDAETQALAAALRRHFNAINHMDAEVFEEHVEEPGLSKTTPQ